VFVCRILPGRGRASADRESSLYDTHCTGVRRISQGEVGCAGTTVTPGQVSSR
jgi:hypothetical protein